MKKYTLLFVLVLCLFGISRFVHAEDGSASANAEVNISAEGDMHPDGILFNHSGDAEHPLPLPGKRILPVYPRPGDAPTGFSVTHSGDASDENDSENGDDNETHVTHEGFMHAQQIKGDILDFKARLEAHKAELKNKFGEEHGSQISDLREKAAERFGGVLVSLNEIADRIGSRLTKMKDSGKDTSAFDALLVTARAKITVAEDAFTALKASITTDTKADGSLKTQADASRNAFRDAHQALVAVVTAIKEAYQGTAHVEGQNPGMLPVKSNTDVDTDGVQHTNTSVDTNTTNPATSVQ